MKYFHCAIVYRHSNNSVVIDNTRSKVNLRSRNKIRFKHNKRNYTVMLKSPLYRGINLWDNIPEAIQHSPTKCKLKVTLRIDKGSQCVFRCTSILSITLRVFVLL